MCSSDLLIAELLGDPDFLERSHAAAALSDLAVTVGSLPNQAMALRLLAGVVEARVSAKLQQIVLTSLGEGLSRRGSSISKLLNFDSSDPALRQRVNKSFKDASRIAGDSEQSLMIRMNAVGLLAFASFDSAKDTLAPLLDRKSTRLNSSHVVISYAVFCLKKKN